MTSTGPARGIASHKTIEPWLSLAVLILLAALAWARSGPPVPKSADAPASEFSAARARSVLARILGSVPGSTAPEEPHPVGTPAHERVRERIVEELARLGLTAEVQEALVDGAHANVALVRNVLARIPGRASRPAVMLAAHYDSVAAGPGAGDDGAGVAALIEIARSLTAEPTIDRDVILLFTDGEELGLLGARAFCAEHRWAHDVGLVINLEGRGTCGPSEMFETGADNARLMQLFGRAVERPAAVSLAYEVYKRMPNDTDMTVFKRAGLTGFNFAFIDGSRRYHTPLDDLAHLDLGSLQHHGDNALALIREMTAEALPRASVDATEIAPARRAVYADILGFVLVRWPEALALPIAILELVACSWCAWRLCRSSACTWKELGGGMLLSLGNLTAAALFGLLLKYALETLSDFPEPWAGRLPSMAVCIASGVLCSTCLLSSRAFLRRVGVAGAWLGTSIGLASIGVAAAIAVPSASYLFAIPCAITALVCLLGSLSPSRMPARLERGLASALPVAIGSVWIPLAIGLERAIEYRALEASAVLFGAVWGSAGPAWLTSPRRRLVILGSAAGLAAVVLSLVLALGAPGSKDEPGTLNFARVLDADRHTERWFAATSGWPLPPVVRQAGAFEIECGNPYPWWRSDREVHASPDRTSSAPTEDLAPLCHVTSSGSSLGDEDRGRVVHVALRSQRGARGIVVHGEPGVRIRAVALHGHELRLQPGPVLGIVGAGAEEIELEIHIDAGAIARIEVADALRLGPEEGARLLSARPETRVPRSEGDVSIVVRSFDLER